MLQSLSMLYVHLALSTKHREPLLLAPLRAQIIKHQETHHRAVTFQEEYRRLLESHGIEFDGRYVWD
jgi:hypothetical protein